MKKHRDDSDEFILGLSDRIVKLSYRTRLIGREKELERLEEIFDEVLTGGGGICFITGEAGSGKSRLADELRDYVYSRGCVLIDGKCSLQSNKIPFEPFKEALNSYFKHFSSYSETRKNEIIEKGDVEIEGFADQVVMDDHVDLEKECPEKGLEQKNLLIPVDEDDPPEFGELMLEFFQEYLIGNHPKPEVKKRREKAKIGSKHVLTPEEAMTFVEDSLGVETA